MHYPAYHLCLYVFEGVENTISYRGVFAMAYRWRHWSTTAVAPWSSSSGGNRTAAAAAAAGVVAAVAFVAISTRISLRPTIADEEGTSADTALLQQRCAVDRRKRPPLRPFQEEAAAERWSVPRVYNRSIPQFQRTPTTTALCEKRADLASPSNQPNASTTAPDIVSWTWRERLLSLVSGMRSNATLLPRRLCPRDPIWTLTHRQLQQRARDEQAARQILDRIVALTSASGRATTNQTSTTTTLATTRPAQELSTLQAQWLETVYGPGVTLADRQAFLERYGCTGWTDEILDALLVVECGHGTSATNDSQHQSTTVHHRGFVEIGAGNGQWARALTDRHRALVPQPQMPPHKHFELVLAYDNYSRLPLNHDRYARSSVARAHFYDRVQPIVDHSAMAAVLQQWASRGRILLLVYPPPESDMAVAALQAYDRVIGHTKMDANGNVGMLVYVGEGRGGANANDAFFDYLEDPANNWILHRVMNVVSFGSKGYEKLYIFQKGNLFPASS
jgi:hypothetical protein